MAAGFALIVLGVLMLVALAFAPTLQPVQQADPFREAMCEFDRRLAYARAHHLPTRAIEQERAAFTKAALAKRVLP